MDSQYSERIGRRPRRLSSSKYLTGPFETVQSTQSIDQNLDKGKPHQSTRNDTCDERSSTPPTETNAYWQDRSTATTQQYEQANSDVEQATPERSLPEHDAEEPLNGRTAWLHAATGFFIVANCWGITNAWGLFQAYYEISYLRGTPPSSIAWIGSTQLALVFGLGFPVGKLVDMGYFHSVFHTGSCLMVLGIFCTAWCKSLPTLWATQGLLTGTGMGFLFCSGSKCCGEQTCTR